jgi:hypothetical protein
MWLFTAVSLLIGRLAISGLGSPCAMSKRFCFAHCQTAGERRGGFTAPGWPACGDYVQKMLLDGTVKGGLAAGDLPAPTRSCASAPAASPGDLVAGERVGPAGNRRPPQGSPRVVTNRDHQAVAASGQPF